MEELNTAKVRLKWVHAGTMDAPTLGPPHNCGECVADNWHVKINYLWPLELRVIMKKKVLLSKTKGKTIHFLTKIVR